MFYKAFKAATSSLSGLRKAPEKVSPVLHFEVEDWLRRYVEAELGVEIVKLENELSQIILAREELLILLTVFKMAFNEADKRVFKFLLSKEEESTFVPFTAEEWISINQEAEGWRVITKYSKALVDPSRRNLK